MTEAHRALPERWEDTDVARIVRTLHRSGPLPLQDLTHEPELVSWSAQRIEHAIVSAWSRNLIFIDRRDLLVAL
jgi:hypothetical protein